MHRKARACPQPGHLDPFNGSVQRCGWSTREVARQTCCKRNKRCRIRDKRCCKRETTSSTTCPSASPRLSVLSICPACVCVHVYERGKEERICLLLCIEICERVQERERVGVREMRDERVKEMCVFGTEREERERERERKCVCVQARKRTREQESERACVSLLVCVLMCACVCECV